MTLDLHGKAVLFDKDGTLFDFTASWAAVSEQILRTLADGDAARLSAMAEASGFDLEERRFLEHSIVIAGTTEELCVVLAHAGEISPRFVRHVVDELVATAQMLPVEGLVDTLVHLREAGAKLGVVTNDSESAAVAHLQANALADLFEAIVGYDSGYVPKPAPGSCLGAASRIGVIPEQCTMVGDSTHDLEAGSAAGMTCYGVLTGIASEQTLAPLARAVLLSVAHLPVHLART